MARAAAAFVVLHKNADEMRAEFKFARLRRLVKRGIECWRDTDLPDQGPRSARKVSPLARTQPPVPEVQ
jgi:hypothetical protein